MNPGLLILVSAPSGAGKTSLVSAALQHDPGLVVSVSHTTRTQRPGEKDGENYHYTDAETFQHMVDAGEFLEHAQVFSHRYGTAREQVASLRNQGRDVILEIDWQGADQVRAVEADTLSIFVLPPSMDILRQRLTARASDSADAIEQRLAEARLEMSQAPRYDYIVVNDEFDVALADILAIIRSTRLATQRQLDINDVRHLVVSD